MKYKMFNTACNVAVLYHNHQVDKAGAPYVLHPMVVANMVETMDERIVAMLHDTVEDSEMTFETLKYHYGFPQYIIDAVDAITNRKDEKEPLDDYLDRVKANPIALAVKLKDVEHNSSGKRITQLSEAEQARLKIKYKYCLEYLLK